MLRLALAPLLLLLIASLLAGCSRRQEQAPPAGARPAARGDARARPGDLGLADGVPSEIAFAIRELGDPRRSPLDLALAAGRLGLAGERARPAIPALVRALKVGPAMARAAAAGALGRIGAAEAVSPLLERLDDESAQVAEAAALALGRLGGATRDPSLAERVVQALGSRLRGEDDGRRAAAAEGVGELGARASSLVEQLARLAIGDGPQSQERAAAALGKLGATAGTARPLLQRATRTGSAAARAAAKRALEQLPR